MKIYKRRFLAFGLMKELAPHIIEPRFLDEEERVALENFAEEEEMKEAQAKNNNNNAGKGNVKEDADSNQKDVTDKN